MGGGESQFSTAVLLVSAVGLALVVAMLMLAGVFGLIDRLGKHAAIHWANPLTPRHRH